MIELTVHGFLSLVPKAQDTSTASPVSVPLTTIVFYGVIA